MRDRTSFLLQCLEIMNIPSPIPTVAKVLVRDSALTSRMLQPESGISSDTKITGYNSGMAGTAVSDDSSSSPQQQQCPV